ncbi:HD-GYP domain-containing protein [Klebsiella aerogenes]|uniref:HD-GYP domain-containing protein n=1 Tax=Klebsiella aerogenes TaxID=548 RepID=UPI001CC1935A|nr:HD domain-containing phosphohydrolase [Klebsiella aerogenes]UAL36251.1 HD domain-containing protein [Klebsiella aerogenes]
MRIALKSALMLVTRVINAINPRLDLHLQRTALISYKLSLALDLPASQQKTIFLAALLHDIGVLGDKRRIDSLNAIDNLYDPHQIRGVQMLAGLDTFTPISPMIGDHHFSPSRKGNLEQHIVYFADCFERLLPSQGVVAPDQQSALIARFVADYRDIDPPLCDRLCELAQHPTFWRHMQAEHIQRLLEIVGPINDVYIDIDGLKDICLLIAKIVDTYSSFTASHSIMVGEISYALAVYMHLPPPVCRKIEIAGYLHDIGKIYIPLAILEKQAELSDDEAQLIREHSYMTGEILRDFTDLAEIIDWAANHHEKLDGSGYPLNLNHRYLQLPDRIIAVADIFTALVEDRPYRLGMPYQEALQLIEADVINGALDNDVYLVLRQHAQALHHLVTRIPRV